MIKLIKNMAKLAMKKFVPVGEDVEQGAVPMSKVEILEALARYKAQNPTKYAAKKEALFARYGLKDADVPETTPDENDVELAKLTTKAKSK